MKKVNELLIYAVMFDSLTVQHVQFVIMLMEFKKVLSQELKCFYVQQDYHSSIRMNYTKSYECVPLIFYCIRTDKYLV